MGASMPGVEGWKVVEVSLRGVEGWKKGVEATLRKPPRCGCCGCSCCCCCCSWRSVSVGVEDDFVIACNTARPRAATQPCRTSEGARQDGES